MYHFGFSQKGLDYFLPHNNHDSLVPRPIDYLGFNIGEWHITHGQLVDYLRAICDKSPRCVCKTYAYTHERKPLIQLIISSPQNLTQLEKIKASRKTLYSPPFNQKPNYDSLKTVIYQGYSIHGNESSGANASVLMAYHLLASLDKREEKLLNDAVIILDPCMNPDGFQRFSTWANTHRYTHLISDTQSREFTELWPQGRTNHYWFDLNRDWLFAIHPSSKGRIKTFQEWQPDILTDHHEMGSNSTFFFQPGVPSRTNPLTPQINQDLTEEISHFHARNLDSLEVDYFSKKTFDDYYYGKGSTYPDINGCIGILFEQASSRGHLKQTKNGLLDFPFTICNQVTTSFSTQDAALSLKHKIWDYKYDFYKNSYESASNNVYYTFKNVENHKSAFFIQMLKLHGIDVYAPQSSNNHTEQKYSDSTTFFVPLKQRQSALIQTMFESVHSFPDSVFYDVSTWTLPLALGIEAQLTQETNLLKLKKVDLAAFENVIEVDENDNYLTIKWSQYNAPQFLVKCLQDSLDISIKKISTEDPISKYYIIIPLKQKKFTKGECLELVTAYAKSIKVDVYSVDDIPDTPKMVDEVYLPKVGLIVGHGLNAYNVGYHWYQMDYRWALPFTMLDIQTNNALNLKSFDVIILSNGGYDNLKPHLENLQNWIKEGGHLICTGNALDPFINSNLLDSSLVVKQKEASRSPAQRIGGAIFEATMDNHHPITAGYDSMTLNFLKKGGTAYAVRDTTLVPLRYSKDPLISGYASQKNVYRISDTAAVSCFPIGEGMIISMVDNPNFRGYWLNGSPLFANSIFLRQQIWQYYKR